MCFKLWYTETAANKNGVGILIDKSLTNGVVDVKRQGDRIILVRLVVGDLSLQRNKREDKRTCLDCKVIQGECVVSQHKLVVADFCFRLRARWDKQAKVVRTKWWKLKGEASEDFKRRIIAEGSWEEGEDADNTWGKMATCIREVDAEVLGVTKGSKCATKDTWWWNEDVQKALKEKKECYKRVFHDRSTDNIGRYKVVKKIAKLSTKEGEKDVYKMARSRDRKTRDLNEVKCIKDARDQLLVKEDIKLRWREYFDNLFNGDSVSTWMTPLMMPIDTLCVGSKRPRLEKP
ncbi:hypothetical protein U9M48_023383 [Paspalum notatum var. saurae]|uniref:Uncharacterized protein n=1 Tax=Paspalum notatum var. saurae TaxID=547442 RepID=A0AAQ3WUN1_PASNO